MTKAQIADVLDLAAGSAFSRSPQESAFQAIEEAALSNEAEFLGLLREHRLQHLFWDSVLTGKREALLSQSICDELRREFAESQVNHSNYEWELISVSDTLLRAGLQVIACKGAILARHYYPRGGLRRMHDIDFWLVDPNIEKCKQELKKLGFEERPEKATSDARNFINAGGVVLDVHIAMHLFQDLDYDLLEVSRSVPGMPYRLFVPEAQIAHLLTHMLGHAKKTGILICWLIDMGLVLRAHQVDPAFVKGLLRDDGSWQVFLRIVRTFSELGWIGDSLGLESEARSVRPVNWESLVRQRRRAAWSGIRGKLRLGRLLVSGTRGGSPLPRPKDILWQPVDWFLEQNPLSARTGAMLIKRDK